MIFVGGLPLDMEESVVRMYFSNYGAISNIEVKRSAKGKSKGFCFITFASDGIVDEIMADAPHEVGEVQVNVQKAADPKLKKEKQDDRRCRKMLVGDIRKEFGHPEIKALLETIGPVEKLTHLRSRNDDTCYCYVVMVNLSDTQKLLEMRKLRGENGLKLKFRPYGKDRLLEDVPNEASQVQEHSEHREQTNLTENVLPAKQLHQLERASAVEFPDQRASSEGLGLSQLAQTNLAEPRKTTFWAGLDALVDNPSNLAIGAVALKQNQIHQSVIKAPGLSSSPKKPKTFRNIKRWWAHANDDSNYRYNVNLREYLD